MRNAFSRLARVGRAALESQVAAGGAVEATASSALARSAPVVPAGLASVAARALPVAARGLPSRFVTSSAAPRYLDTTDDAGEPLEPVMYPSPMVALQEPAPDFVAPAVVDGEIEPAYQLSANKGKWVVLLFYPKDFTFVCPTELIAFSDRHAEFEAINAQVVGISTDTEESHLAWCRMPRRKGGLGVMNIPLVADTTKQISAQYGVLLDKLGIAFRGLFIINPEGVLSHITVNDLPVGRSVDETIRLIQAHQFVREHGEVCPAGWKPGDATMEADPEGSQKYFSSVHGDEDAKSGGEKLKPLRTEAEYKALTSASGVNVVEFMAPWCGKCRQLAPFVDKLAEKYPTMTFAKVDTTDGPMEGFSEEMGVKAMPYFKFFKDGKDLDMDITGYKKKLLEDTVDKLAK
ncbi:unnamed protein product [Pedinophyceae sp. YPF-701]|nr:unnamed protein product [Pedinophyceae sp. YPF-701]